MCGRFNQDSITYNGAFSDRHLTAQRFNKAQAANLSPGMLAVALGAEGYLLAEFGFRPVWDLKKMFINARAEGRGNELNNREGWEIGIHQMPAYKHAFLHSRLAIPVNSFIEGPEQEKLSKPFLIHPEQSDTFYLGAIASTYTNTLGNVCVSFAIITTPAFAICAAIGHHRAPLVIPEEVLEIWLNPNTATEQLFSILKSNNNQVGFCATPLDALLVKSGRLHEPHVLQPAGETLYV
ncbi:MAG: SOS response-associated peptidase [Bacteroidota bacterium]|jgi:putative SOS response-associated peptidase YedK|nr:SOS response-associated peptidase [Sphingobacteriales bacterium]